MEHKPRAQCSSSRHCYGIANLRLSRGIGLQT